MLLPSIRTPGLKTGLDLNRRTERLLNQGMRIFLSPPVQTGQEAIQLQRALDSGYLAPAGPQIAEFEAACARIFEVEDTVALQSGTSALYPLLCLSKRRSLAW